MRGRSISGGLMVVLILAATFRPAWSQQLGIDTAVIRSLIHKWNFANNTRSVETFRNVYGDRLLFYTQDLDKEAAVEFKQDLFESKRGFRQNIESDIIFTAYTSGVVKCDFTKEVWEGSRWRKYLSYLLISYSKSQYEIVGESDYATDETLNYQLNLGEPMEFHAIAHSQVTEETASPLPRRALQQETDTLAELVSRNLGALLSALPPGMMVVPKSSVYVFMGLLLVGGLMIFLADTLETRRKNRRRKLQTVKRKDRAEDRVAELNTQSVFEAFVVTLFDPVLFRQRRPEARRVYAGEVSEAQPGPELEFVYHNKGITGRFAIKCLYFPNALQRRWQLLPPGQLQVLKNFGSEDEMELYYVLGIGGTPDDPKELYLVPGTAIRGAVVTREALKPFAKSGMVYYHRKEGQLR